MHCFRKDTSAHSGGLLVYVASYLTPKRIVCLENILPESLWIEIRDQTHTYLVGTVYRQPNTRVEFCDRVNICLEHANEITSNVILIGDINEDQLDISNHKFRDVLSLNNMVNLIIEPTRVTDTPQTLLDTGR